MKKIIKFINNERSSGRICSKKACDTTAYDYCSVYTADSAECTVYAYDECSKDYAACYEGGQDFCVNIDETVCSGAGPIGFDYT